MGKFEDIIKDVEVESEQIFKPKTEEEVLNLIKAHGSVQTDDAFEIYRPVYYKSGRRSKYFMGLIEEIREMMEDFIPDYNKNKLSKEELENAALNIIAAMVIENNLKIKVVV